MRTKYLNIYIISMIVLIVFAGCGGENAETPDETTGTTETSYTHHDTSETEHTTSQEETTEVIYTPLDIFLEEIYERFDASQVIVSFRDEEDKMSEGKVYAFERNDEGHFYAAISDIDVVYGRNGLEKQEEGDKRSPTGVYSITFAFGTYDIGQMLKIEYRMTTKNDYWVDDIGSDDYNTWQTYEGDPYDRWDSFERLMIGPYRLAFVIDYNHSRVLKKGSAIFFHVWKDETTYTSGCTAASEENVFKIMKWLDPEKNPVIVQGSIAYYQDRYGIDIKKEIGDASF